MVTAPYIPADAPFTLDQQAWLNGFFAGLNTRLVEATPPLQTGTRLLQIAYGTQTGNAELVAADIAGQAASAGWRAHVCALDEIDPGDLAAGAHLVIVVSTYGEGDMPDSAVEFWNRLQAPDAPGLGQVHYTVLALGDRGYDQFCRAGALIDDRFAELGAMRIAPRTELDVDFESHVQTWWDGLLPSLEALTPQVAVPALPAPVAKAKARPRWSRRHPFGATVTVNRRLSGPGSGKEIRHVEINIAGAGLEYRAGDALGVIPVNDPELVAAVLDGLGVAPETPFGQTTFAAELSTGRELTTVGSNLVKGLVEAGLAAEFAPLMAEGRDGQLSAQLRGVDVADVVQGAAAHGVDPVTVVGWLRPLQHRAYSISSSPLAHPESVHLTVATLRYDGRGRRRGGACSTFLADRLLPEEQLSVFCSPNSHFRVPEDPATPMVMVGPGTGVAPFRAFLQERQLTGATGRNWLFFGDQRRGEDFIYEAEWEALLSAGTLTRLDVAFSRDQRDKIYVQTRMLEQGRELYAWLEEGAHFFVCGDAARMAPDVDAALVRVIAAHGGRTDDQAREYVAALRADGRYHRDVY